MIVMNVSFSSGQTPVIPGIEELYRLDLLPSFKESVKVGSVSSYDRTGGNNDGFDGEFSFIRKEKDGLVIADLKGPGVIYRIWTPTPSDDIMEFYFDGEKEPRIRLKFRELFMGEYPPFKKPLVGFGAGGFYSYAPVPYEKSLKILVKAERFQFYQINFAGYPESMGIKSYSEQLHSANAVHWEKAGELFNTAGKDISMYVIPDNAKIEKFERMIDLSPGQKKSLFEIDRPGRIVGIKFNPAQCFIRKDRDIVLRVFWDEDVEPAINCPVGDFFGYAWGNPSMQSLIIGTNDNVNYCYFPMPFDKSARIEMIMEEGSGESIKVEAEVLFSPVSRNENEGKFYVVWHRENPTYKGMPFTFIETEGHGHIVGFVQQSQASESGNTYFFEGDDQTIIDGESVIHGTGSEDFYNGGWYDVPGRWESRRSYPLSGCLDYKKHLGRTGGYRILLGDAYAFRKSILQTIEHAPTNNDLINDYIGVTYLYSEDRPTCDLSVPPVHERRVIDPERIIFAAWWNIPVYSFSINNAILTKKGTGLTAGDGREARVLSMRGQDRDYFGHHSICFTCELPAEGTYDVKLDVVKGPEQGIIQLFSDEAAVGIEADLYNEEPVIAKDVFISRLDFKAGENQIMFKITGRNKKSTGLGFDLINILFEKSK